MEKPDTELLLKLIPINPELQKLYTRHKKLEREVAQLERYVRYSPSMAMRQQVLKKEKLQQKERILELLRPYSATQEVEEPILRAVNS